MEMEKEPEIKEVNLYVDDDDKKQGKVLAGYLFLFAFVVVFGTIAMFNIVRYFETPEEVAQSMGNKTIYLPTDRNGRAGFYVIETTENGKTTTCIHERQPFQSLLQIAIDAKLKLHEAWKPWRETSLECQDGPFFEKDYYFFKVTKQFKILEEQNK